MEYRVIERFKDLQDNDRVYEVGEVYQGPKSKKRIAELSGDENKIGKPLIEKSDKKSDKKQIGYLVEYQRFEDDSLEKTYIQDMKDQGWTLFTNVPVSFRNSGEFIFYTDQASLISQIKVTREDLIRDAQLQFQHGCILACLFVIFFSIFPLSNYTNTFLGFVSHYFFLIIALATILYASIKYILIKKSILK